MNAKPEQSSYRRAPIVWRVLAWIDYMLVGVVVLVVLALCGITIWLTPSRLSAIVDSEASELLDADVKTGDISFTFWSTFPHFCIVADSLRIDSRNLGAITDEERSQLPANPEFLVSTGRMEGGINIARLLRGQIWLRDVVVDSLRLNLVAVNDSVNNYTFKSTSGKTKIPYFNIDRLSFVDGGEVKYFSRVSDTNARIALNEASLMPRGDNNDYHLMFRGNIYARSGGLDFLRGFPFELDGNVHFRFKPSFGMSTSDYVVNLGELKGHMGMDLDFGDDVQLNSFDYHLQDFTLDNLKSFLPADDMSFLKRMDADVQLEALARLTSPYNFSSGYLPSAEVDFFVPKGSVGYTFADDERYAVDNIDIAGKFVFNGLHPDESYVEIPRLNVKGLGADLKASAKVTHLTTNPHVQLGVNGHGDFDLASRSIRELLPYNMTGTADFKLGANFDIVGSSIRESDLRFILKSTGMSALIDGYDISLSGFEASTEEHYGNALTLNATKRNIPLRVNMKADRASASAANGSDMFAISSLSADASLSPFSKGKVSRNVGLSLQGKDVKLKAGNLKADLEDMSVNLKAGYLDKIIDIKEFNMPESWTADAKTMDRVDHTPQFIRVALPQNLKDLINRWQVALGFKSSQGKISIDNYPVQVSGINLDASFDSVCIHNVDLAHGSTRGSIQANISNLRQFLLSTSPAPLMVKADVALDTVQVNQLARDYTLSHPNSAIARNDLKAMTAGNDTLTVILPRNIYADIHATAMQTRYTNLHLYDLMTDLTLRDGVANVDTLHISSSFGQAALKFSYDTSNLQDLRVTTGFRLYDVDVVGFFQNFQKLLAMWPEMKNLSGTLSIGLDGRMHIFPSMNVNMPSLWANAHINGYNLQLNQNHFIKHLAHMLLIYQDGPINIEDVNMQAVVHSNLVELFPTTFEVSKYKLVLMGLNNFDGDIYYHVGVENWPLKIPFGVNIKGDYRHPVLRFGGKGWKDKNGAMITSGVQDNFNFNIVHSVKRYSGEFVHSAATYEE